MKRITLLLFLIACASGGYAQCTNTVLNPSETIVSNNSGDPQEINSCVYTGQYSTVSNLNVGQQYTFSLVDNGTPAVKYITVYDLSSNLIAHGETPLVVPSVPVTSVRIHYSEDENCGTAEWCLNAYVTATLTCPFPTNIQISGVTTTNASFAWTPGNSEEAWEVMVLPKGTEGPTPSTSGTPVTDGPAYSTTTLTAALQYQFYVRADCGSEFSPWRGPFNFNSGCPAVEVLNENFDSVEYGELPTCWTGLFVNAANDAFIGAQGGMNQSPPNSVQLANGSSPVGAHIMLISPNLSTVGTGTHRLKFYARGYGNVSVQVGTINATTANGTFTSIATINATSNYIEYTVDFAEYSGTDTFIAFRHANTATYNPVFLDNIRWELSPLCGDVSDILVTNLTQSTATISWEPGGSETAWDVVYSDTEEDPSLLTPISPAPSDTPEATISGLQANTTYKAWVRSSCGETIGVGAWMNPITFTTACAATNLLNETFESTNNGQLPECWSRIISGSSIFNTSIGVNSNSAVSGTKAVALFNGDGETASKIILVSPSLSTVTTGTHRLKFYARANGSATIQVGTLDSAAEGATFTSFLPLTVTGDYTEYLVDFTNYVGTDTYIGIKHTAGQYITVYLDNIRWEVAPLCADVTAIELNDITANSVAVNWTANANETQWDIVYGTDDVTDPTTLTPISPAPTTNLGTTITGLDDNTNYRLWVRSACGGTQGNGAWIGPIDFKTACLPTASFVEGFEGIAWGNLPDCWSAVLDGPTIAQYAAVRAVDYDSAVGSNAVEMHANSSAPTDRILLVTPYLSTLSAGTHRLKFYASSSPVAMTLQIGTMNGNTSTATYTEFQPIPLGNGYAEYTVDFTTYTGTDTYIAFRNISGNYSSVFIDHVRWEVVPTCTDVSAIHFLDVTDATATVEWSNMGSETNWQVAYGATSVTDPSTLTPSALLTETSMELSGLDANAYYNVWVRSVCGGADGNGAWIGPVVLQTKCSSTTVPYLQDFQSASTPNLPDCSILQNLSSGNNWDTAWGDSGYGFDGTVLRYKNNGVEAAAWYFTQALELTGGSEYVISYKYGNNSAENFVESMQVLYGTAASAAGMTEEIADHPAINTGMATTNEVTFTPAETGAYYFGFVAYSSADQGELYLDNIAVEASLSTPGSNLASFTYYPNPVKDVLHLSYSTSISNVTVFNLLGQKILERTLNGKTAEVDLSGLSSGSYVVKVTADDMIKTIKVIKE